MKHIIAMLVSTIVTAASGAPQAVAAVDLAGTWSLVSVSNIHADGTTAQPYGEKPDGMLTFDRAGRYSLLIFRPGRARFASADKSRGTPEENQATVQGTNSHFGRYGVDPATGTLTFRIDHASFPNWEGTEQRRSFVLENDLLRYTVRTTTTGGTEVAEVTWRRMQ
ncbi:MAG: hypothetical protein JWO56_2860 [Acidobacteria bacterium]|nr:hypothetical protein [Acidobacteriota bacterium]